MKGYDGHLMYLGANWVKSSYRSFASYDSFPPLVSAPPRLVLPGRMELANLAHLCVSIWNRSLRFGGLADNIKARAVPTHFM